MSQQIINISTPDDGLGDVLRNGFNKTNQNFTELYNGKVDKETGRGLSENDFTDADKTKLDGIEAGAEVNVQADWGETDPLSDSFILNKPPSLYSAFGYFHYSDLATQTTPLEFSASTPLQLINDTLGVFTNEDQAPYGISGVWDTSTNALDFSQLSVGDAVLFRTDLSISTTSVNQNLRLYIKFGIGTPSEYDLLIDSWNEKSVITFKEFIKDVSFSIDNEDWRDNPAEIYILSDDDGGVKVNGWYTPIIRKSLNVIDFNNDSTKLDKVTTSGVERAYIINADGSQSTKATSDFGVLETKNKLITIPLGDLGVAIEDVTYEMVSDYITNLGIVVEKGENYYFEVTETYNFDLTSPNWAIEGVTDEASFINWLATRSYQDNNDLTNIVVTDFNFVGDRIFCNMTADGTIYDLAGLGLINADKIGVVNGLTNLYLGTNQIATFNPTIPLPSSLTYLYLGTNQIATFNPTIALPSSLTYLDLGGNQIATFNPTIALPSSLTTLYLGGNQIATFNPTIALPSGLTTLHLDYNQMTLAGYTASEVWANAQPTFTNPCIVYFNNNIDGISGTNLEAILLTKNCTIFA